MHLFNIVGTLSFSHTHMHTHSQTPCYSFYKSLLLCRNRRDSQHRIKASSFSRLRLPSFHLKSFVTITHPIPLPSQHKCVLITSLTVPHTYFHISSSALSLLILHDSPVLSIKLWRLAAFVINCQYKLNDYLHYTCKCVRQKAKNVVRSPPSNTCDERVTVWTPVHLFTVEDFQEGWFLSPINIWVWLIFPPADSEGAVKNTHHESAVKTPFSAATVLLFFHFSCENPDSHKISWRLITVD